MASIVQRGKSYSVVYSVWIDGQKKQKWETYHSYEGAVNRKAQIELIAEMEKARQKYQEEFGRISR